MKSEFSTHWNSSKLPRKQHKYRANAPFHIKHKFLSAHLSKSLKEKYGKRSLPLRKGDDVLVMRGSFKKKRAKVASIDLKNSRVTLEGINRTKKDGAKVEVFFSPSVLRIQEIGSDDSKRIPRFEKKAEKLEAKEQRKEKTEKKNAPKKE